MPGSTSAWSSTRPPIISSRRAATALSSSASSGAALVAVAWVDSLALVVEPGEFERNAWQLLDPAATQQEQHEVADRLAELAEDLLGSVDPLVERGRRIGEDRLQPAGPQRGGGEIEFATPGIQRVVPEGDLEGGFGESAWSRVPAGHQLAEPPVGPLVSARNSDTSRRSRSLVRVSPTTLPAARRARSATSARRSAIARCFSASISAAVRSRSRSSSALVAAMSVSRRVLGDLLSLRQDLVRLAARLLDRGGSLRGGLLAVAPGLLRVLQPLLDLAPPVLQHRPDAPECDEIEDREEHEEADGLGDDPEEVDLESGRLGAGLGEQRNAAPGGRARDRQEVHGDQSVAPVRPRRRRGRWRGCRRRPRGRRGPRRTPRR